MQAIKWTLNRLSLELHRDRRTLERLLGDLAPDTERPRAWYLHRVITHLYRATADGQAPLDLTAERARLAAEQADKESMRNAELRGDLIRVEDARALWVSVLAEVRAHMLSLPTSTAPLVLGLETATDVQEVLDRHVRDALAGCARAGDGVSIDAGSAAEADGQPMGGQLPDAQRGGQRRTRTVAH